jgi:hypothetical protein
MKFGVRARRSLSAQNPLPKELGPIGATPVLRWLVDKQGEVKLPLSIQVGDKSGAQKATECGIGQRYFAQIVFVLTSLMTPLARHSE